MTKLSQLDYETIYKKIDALIDIAFEKKIKEIDSLKYKIKDSYDEFICPLCDVTYTRQCKSQHFKGKKHQKKFNKIKEIAHCNFDISKF